MKRTTKRRTRPKAPPLATPLQGSWLHEPFLERAADPSLPDAGQTALGAFLTLRLIDRFAIGTRETPEQALAYQTQATRDYLLDLAPQGVEEVHLIEIARVADAVRTGSLRRVLWPSLQAYAYWLEQELRLSEALDVVETGLRVTDGDAVGEQTAANLQRGRILRLLGRFDEAREAYETARSTAMTVGDMHSALLGRIGQAIVMRHVGNLPASENELRNVIKDAHDLADRDALARAYHDLGLVLSHQQRQHEAAVSLYRGFELYEEEPSRLRALADVGLVLKRLGQYAAAEDAFAMVLAGHSSLQTRAGIMQELLEISARRGNRLAFQNWKRQLEGIASQLPAEWRVDFDIAVGEAYGLFGLSAPAQERLQEAIRSSEKNGLGRLLFRAEAALKHLNANRAAPTGPERLAVDDSAEIQAVAEKLHLLRTG